MRSITATFLFSLLAVATGLCSTGCEALGFGFAARIEAEYPESLKYLFVIVGSEKDLDPDASTEKLKTFVTDSDAKKKYVHFSQHGLDEDSYAWTEVNRELESDLVIVEVDGDDDGVLVVEVRGNVFDAVEDASLVLIGLTNSNSWSSAFINKSRIDAKDKLEVSVGSSDIVVKVAK